MCETQWQPWDSGEQVEMKYGPKLMGTIVQ
jgi:hypothetical protein